MKRLTSLVMAFLIFAIGATTVRAQNTRYFDVNDDAANSGVVDNTSANPYAWNASTLNWNPNADGSGIGPGTTTGWVNGDNAVFSAGADASGHRYFVTIGAGTTANSAVFEEGTTVLNTGSVLDTGSGTAEVLAGATLETIAQNQFNAGGVLKLSGGRLLDTNPSTTAQNLLSPLKTIEINGTGTIEYNDGSGTERQSNISGNVITGTGGTPSTGGAGTLVKSGPDVLVYAGADIGGGHFSWELNSFAKLVVRQGSFRINRVLISGNGFIDERLFGAVPVNPLADAITLDGGGIGATQAVTLDAKRGITITATGGFFDTGGMASINVPGPVTAPPTALLKIGNVNSPLPSSAAFEFSNPNNVTTFQGNVTMLRGVLQLDSSLNVANFSGLGASTTNFGTVRIAAGTTLTVGSDNLDASFDGSIADLVSGPAGGIFTKVGSGTLTLNTENSSTAVWSNTGGVNISNGTIKYASLKAGFTDTKPVSIGATGKLNMSGFSDTIGSLSGPAGAIVDMRDAALAPGALTFAATSGTTTYSGTIIGGGNLTKTAGATQILAGNSTLNTVAVNGGTLRTNATMTTSGGVTVASAGTLGGTGTVVGAITNNGIIAPGDAGIGTLNVTGNLTDGANSHWAIELSGSTADKIAVAGNISLTAVDSLDVTGAASGSSWLIGTYTGSLTGTFDNVTAPYTVTYAGGNITLNAPPTGLLGDFNNDGKVDAGDFVTWKKNEDTSNALVNDNGLGTPIGSDHYNLWRANFGNPPGAGSGAGLGIAPVAEPEPASMGLAIVGVAAFGLGRRRRCA
jgi:hypothetical protein